MFECLKNILKERDYIYKKELELYTGGVLTQYTFTNLTKKEPFNLPKSFVISHKIAYKIDDIIQWLEKNTELVNFETKEKEQTEG